MRDKLGNVISIGDSNFEMYGTVGAVGAYVQNRFKGIDTKEEDSAYVQAWQCFDNDNRWSDGFEGVHEGHVFKVRTKVMRLVDSPSPSELAQQLTLVQQWIPAMVCLDGSFRLSIDENLDEKTVQSIESALGHWAYAHVGNDRDLDTTDTQHLVGEESQKFPDITDRRHLVTHL